jgi:redox-sensitive bicupin YhaK (pirin superfamily)
MRAVVEVVQAERKVEGGGFVVRRPFPTVSLDHIDPFLLLDEMGPVEYGPGEAVGAPEHPHRGFETVTYLLHGAMEHRDSSGGVGTITPGGVQWMTAGSGVVHSELPPASMLKLGGKMHGFQLWVNLPAAKKMIAPRYQGFDAEEIVAHPLANGGVMKVVAGEVAGVQGKVNTTSPVTYAHIEFAAGDQVAWAPQEGHTALVHVFGGEVEVNGEKAVDGQMVVLERGAGEVRIHSASGASVLLLGGEPLGEPVARYGPFVMNTQAEIVQAFEEYQAGTLVR